MFLFNFYKLSPMLRKVLISTCLSISIVGIAQAEVVVITNKASPDLTKEQVSDIYMGKLSTLPGGVAAVPHDLPESSAVREEYYSKLTGKSAAQVKSYWAKMSFTGKGIPPKEAPNSADMKKIIAASPGAIGYIEKSAVDASVKTVLILN